MDSNMDKEWARKYLLDPLTAPEPNQECGPGSSFICPTIQRQLSINGKQPQSAAEAASAAAFYRLPTPPSSASPTRQSFHPSNPFNDPQQQRPLPPPTTSSPPISPRGPGPRQDVITVVRPHRLQPPSPRAEAEGARLSSEDERDRHHRPLHGRSASSNSAHASPPPRHRRHPSDDFSLGPVPARASTVNHHNHGRRFPPQVGHHPSLGGPHPHPQQQQQQQQQRQQRQINGLYSRPSVLPNGLGSSSSSTNSSNGGGIRRQGSLSSRFPGDMSHRPLDMLRREAAVAERSPSVRRHRAFPATDMIDGLDQSSPEKGVAFHHGGPFDAVLASRNTNPRYAPVAAVRDSNLEALKATPPEFIKDAVERHMPLQGVASIPPGDTDMEGNVMAYREGADLMREPDAEGGAYKRWDFLRYNSADLKGKGEPSIREHARPGAGGILGRQRSISAGAGAPGAGGATTAGGGPLSPLSPNAQMATATTAADGGLKRSNTTGRRFAEGLKRRFGSLRRKPVAEQQQQ